MESGGSIFKTKADAALYLLSVPIYFLTFVAYQAAHLFGGNRIAVRACLFIWLGATVPLLWSLIRMSRREKALGQDIPYLRRAREAWDFLRN